MFAKPYKLKSNNTLKNSEKKQLVQRMRDEFPSASEEKLKELVPVKSNSSCMKLVLHSGDTVGVFVVDGVPVLLDTERGLVPTVCALWKIPDLVPIITIHSPVLPKILGGAPLYVPGVEVPARGAAGAPGAAPPFPAFPRGALLAARTTDNAAAALVGRAILSSADILFRATGVCLETLQVVGDLLCKEPKFSKLERPALGPGFVAPADSLADDVAQLNMEPVVKEEWPALGRREPPRPAPEPAPASAPVPHQPALIPDAPSAGSGADTPTDDDDTLDTDSARPEDAAPTDMDELLRWSLLCFLKLEGKNIELPLKTSLLYRNHLIPLCPPDRSLDVKKSSYKKMGKFLEAMQQEGLVEVREIEKGVDALTAVSLAHCAVRALRVPADARARARARAPPGGREREGGGEREREYTPPQVREMLCVTAHVAPVFPHLKKGTALTSGEVRAALTEYVKTRGLLAAEQRGTLVLDAPLAKICNMQEQECIKWEALMGAVTGRMTAATEMRFSDGVARLAKSKLEPVRMQVVTRSGNKKVTLVSNLEAYGFSLGALARASRPAAGAAGGVARAPGAASDQLMLQGDQTHFVAKLLIEKYGLPKKFVEGADKALNKKK